MGFLMTLKTGIDFNAIDNEPVDIVFVLIVPESEHEQHLKTLAGLAELFSNRDILSQLRQAEDKQTLYTIATGS